jgi:hypothetical protein
MFLLLVLIEQSVYTQEKKFHRKSNQDSKICIIRLSFLKSLNSTILY